MPTADALAHRRRPVAGAGAVAAVAGLLLLAACTSGDGVPDPAVRATTTTEATSTAPPAAEVTVRGVVAGVFASARVVQLNPPVNGFVNVALGVDTEIVRADRTRGGLNDVTPGSTIEAVGRPGTPDTLVARQVTLLG